MRRSYSLLAATSLVAASMNAQTPRVRDSAGVRIIENPSRLQAPIAFRISDKPIFDAGGLENNPDDEISSRQGYWAMARLRDGRVVIGDRIRLQYFDAAGKRLKIVGREGRGPGEFLVVSSLCEIHGDSLLAGDEGNHRISLFDPSGTLVSSSPFGEHGYSERAFCFDDGTNLAIQRVPTDPSRRLLRLNRVARDASLRNAVADVDVGPFDMAVRRESQTVATAHRVYFGNALSYDINVFSADGKLSGIIRTDDKLIPVDKDAIANAPPMAHRAGASAAEIKADQQRIAASSQTKYWPTYDRMFVDLDGRLWVKDWTQTFSPAKGESWTAFDSTGRLIGRLQLPPTKEEARTFAIHFGQDEVFVARKDDDGAVHFTGYRLLPVKK